MMEDVGSQTGRFRRRITDASDEISDLIHAENDPSKRGLLIILNKFSLTLSQAELRLEELSLEQVKISNSQKELLERETKIFYRGKGWRDIAGLVVVLSQALCFYLWSDVSNTIKEVSNLSQREAMHSAEYDKRLSLLEQLKTDDKRK